MKKSSLLCAIAAAALLVGPSAAKAVDLQLNAVTPLDTFSFDLVGFNIASNVGSYIAGPASATFGTTTTLLGAGINGQNITISSSESIGVTSTTDTFTISTPTNFLSQDSINGTLINGLQFDIGTLNSGSNAVSVLLPITSYTAAGSTIYGTNTTVPIGTTTLFPTTTSYAAALGVNTASDTTAINAFTVHSFTYSITYANVVPEPSTWAMLGFGAIVGAVVIRRRRLAL